MNVTLLNAENDGPSRFAACVGSDAHSPVLQQRARNMKPVAACMLTRSAATKYKQAYKQAPVLWDLLRSPDFSPLFLNPSIHFQEPPYLSDYDLE